MADAESVPSNERKQELLKHLKNVSTYNYIIQFCKLLISSQKLLDQSKSTVAEDFDPMLELTQKSDVIFERIKEVVAAVSAEVLIQKLFEALDTELKPMDERKLRSFLLETNNIKSSINSVEYLGKLICSIDRVMKLYYNSKNYLSISNPLFPNPAAVLLKLDVLVCCRAYRSADTILDVILSIHLDNVEVSLEEKNEWRCLLLEIAHTFKQSIEYDLGEFMTLFEILEARSSIEYVLDLFAECPKEYEIFSQELGEINACKVIYDELIERKYDLYKALLLRDDINDDDAYFSDEDYDLMYSKDILDDDRDHNRNPKNSMTSKIPVSHTWWQKFKRNATFIQL